MRGHSCFGAPLSGLRHDGERAAVRILEERHPFLGAIGVAVNHVRRVRELHAALFQCIVRGGDVGHAQVKDRLLRGAADFSCASISRVPPQSKKASVPKV